VNRGGSKGLLVAAAVLAALAVVSVVLTIIAHH
jgi:hypothetical protein